MQYLLCVATHIALTTFPPIGSAASQSNYAGAIDVCPHHPPRQGKAGNPDGVQPAIYTAVHLLLAPAISTILNILLFWTTHYQSLPLAVVPVNPAANYHIGRSVNIEEGISPTP